MRAFDVTSATNLYLWLLELFEAKKVQSSSLNRCADFHRGRHWPKHDCGGLDFSLDIVHHNLRGTGMGAKDKEKGVSPVEVDVVEFG